jgi:hypothetical protein
MEPEKISLDVRESNKITRYSQFFFSLLCFGVAIWLFIKLVSTGTPSGSNIIAVAFILLFGVWELVSGLGITQRYISLTDDRLTIKHRYFAKPVIYRPADIKLVVFKPLSFNIVGNGGERTVIKLGNYYQERTLKILESVENFCKAGNVATEGLEKEEEQQ